MFRRYLAALRRRWWLLPLGVLIALVAATLVYRSTPPRFESNIRLITGQDAQSGPSDYSSIIAQQEQAKFFAARVTEPATMSAVIAALQLQDIEPQQLARFVSVELIPETRLIDVTVNSADPQQAAAIANAIGAHMEQLSLAGSAGLRERVESEIDRLDERSLQAEQELTQLEQQIAAATTAGTDATELIRRREVLRTYTVDLASIRSDLYPTLRASSSGGVTVAAPAVVPTDPTSLGLGRTLGIAGVLGLVLALALALVLDMLDDSIRSPEHLPVDERMPFLGSVPRFPAGRKRSTALVARFQPSSPATESYRAIRTALRGVVQSSGPQTMLITSSQPSEGKTTTAANLGVLLAQMGRRVVLVDADLRNPSLHLLFEMSNSVGLSNALQDDEAALSPHLMETGVERLRLLASGPPIAHTAELIASGRMEMLLMTLMGTTDVVLFDTPPVLSVTDAAVLAPRVDHVMLVAGAGIATEADVVRARDVLLSTGAALVGIVLAKTDRQLNRYYGAYGRVLPGEFDESAADDVPDSGNVFARAASRMTTGGPDGARDVRRTFGRQTAARGPRATPTNNGAAAAQQSQSDVDYGAPRVK